MIKTFQFLIISFLTLIQTYGLIAQQKYALLVGIANYPTTMEWQSLSSGNDIQLIKETLIQQSFNESNITILLDEKATKKGVLEALTLQAEKVKKGDFFFFHFSGHGQQVADDNGDEIDGLDEAIVPYDSPKKYIKGIYEGENLIRDEILGSELDKIRQKLGREGHLFVLLDACHSGTGTRGLGIARGTDEIMADPNNWIPTTKTVKREANQIFETESPTKEATASMFVLFSSSPNELSYEVKDPAGKGYGALSYAFSKTIQKTSGETYFDLFENIGLEMSKQGMWQTPQYEGQQFFKF